jgi:hypothetical protein
MGGESWHSGSAVVPHGCQVAKCTVLKVLVKNGIINTQRATYKIIRVDEETFENADIESSVIL